MTIESTAGALDIVIRVYVQHDPRNLAPVGTFRIGIQHSHVRDGVLMVVRREHWLGRGSLLTPCTRKSVGEIDSTLPIWGSVNLLRTFAVKEDMRKQADKLGCDWDQKQRVFRLADGEGPPLALTAPELIELGVELVMLGTKAMVERRWQ